MMKLDEKQQHELSKLYETVTRRRKEQHLEDLASFFKKWGSPKREKKKAEEKILEFYHLCESARNTDSFLWVADGLSDGILEPTEISKELFSSLEVVVRLMKN